MFSLFFTSAIPKLHGKLYSTYVVWLMLRIKCKVFCITGDTKLRTGQNFTNILNIFGEGIMLISRVLSATQRFKNV